MRHFIAGAALTVLSRVFGLSQMEAAGFGATAVTGYELYQVSTNSGVAEWKDVGTGLVGVALVSLVPDRKARKVDTAAVLIELNALRIRAAIKAECDSVRTGKKILPDSIWIHRVVCK